MHITVEAYKRTGLFPVRGHLLYRGRPGPSHLPSHACAIGVHVYERGYRNQEQLNATLGNSFVSGVICGFDGADMNLSALNIPDSWKHGYFCGKAAAEVMLAQK